VMTRHNHSFFATDLAEVNCPWWKRGRTRPQLTNPYCCWDWKRGMIWVGVGGWMSDLCVW
jgi:hypothetical protein